ncbi:MULTISPECIES: hypothetical protein [unclassified Rhizobacter]|uniref:hypothetical protein n=1 Tax=unclassified Rhizobacter TaxID=2640088 RepID=UPI0006FCD854|nr:MULTISPECIES: hypothetical protein [unclassified Rhizobacter]KQU78171.1 hypothetical protein ASC88_20335 [Rhizobacter sp. Root29]KQW15917.1 hypothetical protein ASC98_01555 [Rhizobacter sp. Root1238]KRB25032.1 hypothetical protein ASE08_02290 [Rhizobacter sp. Root16D2]
MSNDRENPDFDREELAQALSRMESRLRGIDESTSAARGDLEALHELAETMKELAVDFRGYYVGGQVAASGELARHLRHIKLLLLVIAVATVARLIL